MKINPEKCVGCQRCIPYCPVAAIKVREGKSMINQDECVECGACLKAGVCQPNALYQPPLAWPRSLRYQFSDPLGVHPGTKVSGRGTDEMKTNDTAARFRLGEVGFGIEMGRPGIATTFQDLEIVTQHLASLGVEFEPKNPVTQLLNPETGVLKYPETRRERVLSAIIEFKIRETQISQVLMTLETAAQQIETVFSVSVISRCQGSTIPILPRLQAEGYQPRVNGKTNLGFGRPLGK
jgi:NAD-dependent dihydropyrimidine dehydrogenase PreA subunit